MAGNRDSSTFRHATCCLERILEQPTSKKSAPDRDLTTRSDIARGQNMPGGVGRVERGKANHR